MTPINPPKPPGSNDKIKRIIIGVLGLIMAAFLLHQAISGFQARQKAIDSPGQSAPP